MGILINKDFDPKNCITAKKCNCCKTNIFFFAQISTFFFLINADGSTI